MSAAIPAWPSETSPMATTATGIHQSNGRDKAESSWNGDCKPIRDCALSVDAGVRPRAYPNDRIASVSIARTLWFDWIVRQFIADHPDEFMILIGSGLNTRANQGAPPASVDWIDTDLISWRLAKSTGRALSSKRRNGRSASRACRTCYAQGW